MSNSNANRSGLDKALPSTANTINTNQYEEDRKNTSWCRNVSTKRKSLMHPDSKTKAFTFMNQSEPMSTSSDQHVNKMTALLKIGHGPGSVLLDTTGWEGTPTKLLQIIAEQYPSRNGVLFRKDGDVTFAEINFNDNDDATLNAILEKGVTFDNQLVVIPCMALNYETKIIYVGFFNLPMVAEKKLFDDLLMVLSKYGDVLDVGTLLEPISNTYMGNGYAIIDIGSDRYKQLTHVIPYSDEQSDIYAVWDGMPEFCQCCHAEDHAFENCAKRKLRDVYIDDRLETNINENEKDAYMEYILFTLTLGRDHINIWVSTLSLSSNVCFKIRRSTQLIKVKNEFCKRMGRGSFDLHFLYMGARVLDDDTPEKLRMRNGDKIDVMVEMRG